MTESSARRIVRARSGGVCELCRSRRATSVAHRLPRSHGGVQPVRRVRYVAPMAGTIRTLRHGDLVPEGEPRRYKTGAGYVALRWKTGPDTYVEVREHRLVAGIPPISIHVQHIDGDKSNNDPSNLRLLSSGEHTRLHMQERTKRGKARDRERAARRVAREAEWVEIARRYAAGENTTQLGQAFGLDPSNISRGLRQRGHTLRPGNSRPYTQEEIRAILALDEVGIGTERIAVLLAFDLRRVRETLRNYGRVYGPGRRPARP